MAGTRRDGPGGWLRLAYRVDAATGERLAESLESAGALAVSVAGREARFDEPGTPETGWRSVTVSGLFPGDRDPDVLARTVAGTLGGACPDPQVERLAERDWARAWMDRYRPVHAGGRLWICPSWCTPPEPDAVNVILDPGLAFGTGTHPTTALCLAWLAGQPPEGLEVVDYGCGSGILAIAALKLGARRALAVDLDPRARDATRDNARRNGVAERLSVLAPEDFPAGASFPLVMANILAGPLIALQPVLGAAVAPGGTLLLSGILRDQAESVCAAYGRAGLRGRRIAGDEWALLVLQRPG